MAIAVDGAVRERLDAIREDDALEFDAVHSLVPRVEDVLIPARPADVLQLAIYEAY